MLTMPNKIFITFLLCSLSFFTLAKSPNWSYPEPYSNESGYLPNGNFYSLIEDEASVKVAFIVGINDTPSSWITNCFKKEEKGILVPACLVQRYIPGEEEDSLKVLIYQNKHVVVFPSMNAVEVNYKVDKNPIVTLDRSYLVSPTVQKKILDNLLGAKKVTYSYKIDKNGKYQTKEAGLAGFKENIEFAKKFVHHNY